MKIRVAIEEPTNLGQDFRDLEKPGNYEIEEDHEELHPFFTV